MCIVTSTVFVSVAAQGLSLEDRTAVGGETPLTLAINARLVDNVKSLLEHGASPHATNSKNESPLLLGNTAGPGGVATAPLHVGGWDTVPNFPTKNSKFK